MIKLIATDMDGTLVNSKKELPSQIFDTIKKLREKNIYFAIASGRQYFNLIEMFDSVKDDLFFIAENGGMVFKNNKKLYVEDMPKEYLREALEVLKDVPHVHPILCGEKASYYVPDSDVFVRNAELYFKKAVYVDNLFNAIDKDHICKIAIYDEINSTTNCYPYIKHLNDKCKVVLSSDDWVDICSQTTNKGTGIKIIQKELGITDKETMAFGDYMNDLELMQNSFYSYAMENAHPDLKKHCNFTAPSNDDNGVIRVIQEKILA